MRALAYHNLFTGILCVFLAASIIGVGAFAGRQIESTAMPNDKVVIRQRTIILKRGEKGRDYKEAIVKIPQIAGISDPDALRKVRANLDLKNIFGDSLEEIRSQFKESFWLDEITYKVNYNANYILDITFFESGVGAYPDTLTEHRIINLKTGALLKAADVFKFASLDALVKLVEGAMRAELREGVKEYGQDEFATTKLKETLQEAKFGMENLDNFSVNNNGVTFLYDFGFPHVIKALEPSGRYFFSYESLKEHIKTDGLLGVFVGVFVR
ncbi:MAG TPA: hypothetical protein VG324_25595 [Blastocatellia bacterium]|nr:hypothetical protein [Blastocatellia bacterium]